MTTDFTEPRTQVEFHGRLCRHPEGSPRECLLQIDRLSFVNDGWMQSSEERQANCDMLEALAQALEDLGILLIPSPSAPKLWYS